LEHSKSTVPEERAITPVRIGRSSAQLTAVDAKDIRS
jgi:hypothetical protein